MITSSGWFISLISATLWGASLLASPGASPATGVAPRELDAVELTTRLTPSAIAPGEHAVLEIRLPLGIPASTLKDEDLPTINDELLANSAQLKLVDKSGKRDGTSFVWRFVLTAHKMGKLIIPPLEVDYGPKRLSTEAQALEIASHRAAGDNELRPEYGEVAMPWPWHRWLWWLVDAGLLGLAAWLFHRYLWPRLKWEWPRLSTRTQPPAGERPEVWLRRELEALRARFESAPSPEHVDELTSRLREYFARRARRPVRGWTSPEIRRKLSDSGLPPSTHDFLARCDRFKFAGNQHDFGVLMHEGFEESERILTLCGT